MLVFLCHKRKGRNLVGLEKDNSHHFSGDNKKKNVTLSWLRCFFYRLKIMIGSSKYKIYKE